jgi:hypothetical protein
MIHIILKFRLCLSFEIRGTFYGPKMQQQERALCHKRSKMRVSYVFIKCLTEMGIYSIINLYGSCVSRTHNLASFIVDLEEGNVSSLSTGICIRGNNSNSWIIQFN